MSYSTAETYRRMHRTNVITAVLTIAPLTIVFTVLFVDTWVAGVVFASGSAAALVVVNRWNVAGVPRFAVPSFVVASAVWGLSAGLFANPAGFFPLVIIGALIIPRLPRWRVPMAVAFGVFVVAVGALGLIDGRLGERSLVVFVVIPGASTLFVTLAMFLGDKYWVHLRDLERSRKAEAELGIMRERMRFAGDLHDIQGHTLHVVKLKVALAQKLLHTDTDRAAAELQEVHELVGDTISQTKQLAHAQHKLNLAAELENAKNLFEAAGITVHIAQDGEVRDGVNELLGQVLRETTTNILRHSQAGQVRIRLSETAVEIVNDGVPDGPLPDLNGLATLRDRVAAEGGQFTVEQEVGRFRTAARFDADSALSTGGAS